MDVRLPAKPSRQDVETLTPMAGNVGSSRFPSRVHDAAGSTRVWRRGGNTHPPRPRRRPKTIPRRPLDAPGAARAPPNTPQDGPKTARGRPRRPRRRSKAGPKRPRPGQRPLRLVVVALVLDLASHANFTHNGKDTDFRSLAMSHNWLLRLAITISVAVTQAKDATHKFGPAECAKRLN